MSLLLGLVATPVVGQVAPEAREWEEPAGSLRAVRRALRQAHRAPARLLFYGASHTASDQFTGVLRERLQRRFGNGGPGFVMPVRPFSLYAHTQVTIGRGGPWTPLRIFRRERRPGPYGMAGMGAAIDGSGWARMEMTRPVASVTVHVQQHPGGGRLGIVAGSQTHWISTAGPERPRAHVVRLAHPQRRIRIRAEGQVTLFGAFLENDTGVVVDTAGVPGARARDQLLWNESVQGALLRDRQPDLVALAYGTNESAGGGRIAEYRARLERVMDRIDRHAPDASCLLIGPGEWPRPNGQPRPRTARIVSVQREVARERGCAFFDLHAFMGGDGSMARWTQQGLGLGDGVHFTDAGHERIGRALFRYLVDGVGVSGARTR